MPTLNLQWLLNTFEQQVPQGCICYLSFPLEQPNEIFDNQKFFFYKLILIWAEYRQPTVNALVIFQILMNGSEIR